MKENPNCSFILRGDHNDCAHAGGGRGAKDEWCDSCKAAYGSAPIGYVVRGVVFAPEDVTVVYASEAGGSTPVHRASVLYRELKQALAEVHEDDRAEALGPHPMVGQFDCGLCGEGLAHYLHITEKEAVRE